MTGLRWYVHDHTVYAMRGPEPASNDPIVTVSSSAHVAQHIADGHNSRLGRDDTLVATRIVPGPRGVRA